MSLFLSVLAIFLCGAFVLLKRKKETAFCSVCEEELLKIEWVEGFAFCPPHADLYLKGRWVTLVKGSASPEDPEFGVRLYEFKRELVRQKLRSFLRTRYETFQEEIITKMELVVLEEDLEKARALSKPIFNS